MTLLPEDSTPLDPEEARGLRLAYVSSRRELNEAKAMNVEAGLRWAGHARPLLEVLTTRFLTELHRQMFGDVWRWAGSFRRSDKNIGVAWWSVPTAIEALVRDATAWVSQVNPPWSADETAVRFHHQLVAIHAFPNGNGRHSRAAADLMVEAMGMPRFTWGRTSLIDPGAPAAPTSMRSEPQTDTISSHCWRSSGPDKHVIRSRSKTTLRISRLRSNRSLGQRVPDFRCFDCWSDPASVSLPA